jgi:CysZ protein
MRFLNDVIRMIFVVLLALTMELAFLFVYWTLSFALGLDIVDPIVYFLISAFFFGFAMYDYSLERYGIRMFGTLTFAFEHMLTVILTGSIFLGLYNIPYVGIPLSPVITVMVSTIVYLYMTKKLPVESNNKIETE